MIAFICQILCFIFFLSFYLSAVSFNILDIFVTLSATLLPIKLLIVSTGF